MNRSYFAQKNLGMKHSRSGFTLIEALVVLVIIATLAATLFVVVGKMKGKAQASTCLSNLRQMTTASLLYASEHNGNLPSRQDLSNKGGEASWGDTLGPYMGWERNDSGGFDNVLNIKTCPTQYAVHNQSRTYGINYMLTRQQQGGEKGAATLNQMSRGKTARTQLSAIPLFMDGVFNGKNWKSSRNWAEGTFDENSFPHDGCCNVSFLDGHAEVTKPKQDVWGGDSAPRFENGSKAF
ncbi:MAG: type II secretion system protein [Luteolibacter sp.]